MPKNIETTYGKLLSQYIPAFEKIQTSLITILKAHSETNLSSLIGYLLKGDDHSILKKIVLESIVDSIELNNGADGAFLNDFIDCDLDEVFIDTEYTTKFGRIDILIVKTHPSDQSKRRAIIIENKLYHELNNDLDDYFYSVCDDFNIHPKNVALVILSLKQVYTTASLYMKHAGVIHKDLKAEIVEGYKNELSMINDRSIILIAHEYFRHIDDLYLEATSFENDGCLGFYADNRPIINLLVKDFGTISGAEFDGMNDPDKKYVFENKTNIDRVIELHRSIIEYTDKGFKHFLELTNRKVGGNSSVPYFRGSGASYDIIRYQLDYKKHFFEPDKKIGFNVWLNEEKLNYYGIDLKEDHIQQQLAQLKVNTVPSKSTPGWIHIHYEELEIDRTILKSIFKDNIDNRWIAFEEILMHYVHKKQLQLFVEKVQSFFSASSYEVEGKDNFVVVHSHEGDLYLKYIMKLTPPDLIEVTLYVNNTFWSYVVKKYYTEKEFLVLNELQSNRIPSLPEEDTGREASHYDALLKKSYRVKAVEEAETLLKLEMPKWAKEEHEIIKIIDNIKPPR